MLTEDGRKPDAEYLAGVLLAAEGWVSYMVPNASDEIRKDVEDIAKEMLLEWQRDGDDDDGSGYSEPEPE